MCDILNWNFFIIKERGNKALGGILPNTRNILYFNSLFWLRSFSPYGGGQDRSGKGSVCALASILVVAFSASFATASTALLVILTIAVVRAVVRAVPFALVKG